MSEADHGLFSFDIYVKVCHISNDSESCRSSLFSKNGFPLQRNRMMSFTVYLIYIVWFFAGGECTCTFPFTGSWHSSNYDNMVFSGSGLYISGFTFARTSIVGSGWECYSNTGNTYVVKTNNTITLSAGGSLYYAYTCFVFTSVNTYSYYYYQNTPVESLLKNERVIARPTGSTVTSGDVCSDAPSAAEYNVMVQSGQETNAKTNIAEVMFANFHYKYNDGVSDKCGTGTSDSMLTICTDRQTLTFDYTVCSDVMMYSTRGVLGSVATIESGTTYYTTVYNYDTTVDRVNTFRFTCIASAASGNQVSATINPKSCIAGQSPTSRPSNGGIFTMVANSTCEITTTTTSTTTTTTTTTPTTTTTTPTTTTPTTTTNLTSTLSNIPALTATVDNVDVAAIIGGVIGGVLFIVIVVIIILLCIRHHKIKRRKQEVIDRRMRIWKIRSNEDDFYGDEVPLNETSMNLDCSQTIDPEPSLVKSPSIVTKLSQKRRKDSETDSRVTQLGNALENPMGETSFQVETHRNREKIPDMLTFPRKRTENMPWRTGRRAEKKGYSSERGYPSMSKFGSLTSRSYTTLKTPRSNMSSRLEDSKNGTYSRSDLNLSRSLTATGHQFKSDTNIYAKAKSLTEKSLARELTAIKEVPRKETPNYMKPIRSKTAMSINKERAKSRHSVSRHFDSRSRVSMTRNESRMTHQKDALSEITRVGRKTMTPREQVMSRAKSKAMKENAKTWRISEKVMPNPKPADEKSFVESLRANNPPSQKKKKKPKKVVVKKLKTPYGVVHVDASQKRAVSMMSLNQLAGLVQIKKRKLPTRSQVDVHRETTVVINPREENEEVKETDAQKGALEFMESEYTWMTSNPKTEEPTNDTTDTYTDKGVTTDKHTDKGVTKTKRVGSEDSGFSDNHSPPANTRDQTEELELINILPPKRPPKFFKNISDRAKTAKSRNPSWK